MDGQGELFYISELVLGQSFCEFIYSKTIQYHQPFCRKINIMKLYFPILDEKIKTLQEKMEEMVVAHELIEKSSLKKVKLEFGKDRIEGVEAIQIYLDDLHRDMQKGYFCVC